MRPEDAADAARERAAAARARGGYDVDVSAGSIEPLERPTFEQLLEWAILDPDLDEVRSTRRFGAPITFVKRLLARGMRQYNAQLIAQQQRFNIQLALYARELEKRLDERD